MKNLLVISLMLISALTLRAQHSNTLSLGISYNKAELAYRYYFTDSNLSTQIFTGIASQDVNNKFDDLYLGIRGGLNIISFTRSYFYTDLLFGLYFTNNNYFKITTPFTGISLGYNQAFDEKSIHSIFIEAGYQYGKKKYSQSFSNKLLSVESIEKFELSSLHLMIGYKFSF